MQELKEPVNIPGIYAQLIAAPRAGTKEELVARGLIHESERYYGISDRPEHQVVDWRLSLFISGPDGRYRGALGAVTSQQHPSFVDALRKGLNKLEVLVGKSFPGEFRTRIPYNGAPEIEVVAKNGTPELTIGLTSETFYTWRASFGINQVHTLIATVEELATRGPALVEVLQELM